MDFCLYRKVKKSARYCRDQKVRRRISLFLLALRLNSVSEACLIFGVSRQNYYRWWRRFERSEFDVLALQEKSRTPLSCPWRVSGKIISKIKKYRLTFRYGPQRIKYYLKRNHKLDVSESTIRRVIERKKWFVKKYRTKKVNPHKKRYNLPWPGMNVQVDIKYVPYRIEGQRVFVFNAIDDCTRYRFVKAYSNKGIVEAVDFARELAKAMPFPISSVQTDNDACFTYRCHPYSFDCQHSFETNLEELGIKHRLIPPGAKELNGKVERSHKTDEEEFYWKSPRATFRIFCFDLNKWILEYNWDRPHSSLGGLTPIEKFFERFLVAFWALLLHNRLDPMTLFELKEEPKHLKKFNLLQSYLNFLDWDLSAPKPCHRCLELVQMGRNFSLYDARVRGV